MNFYNFRHHQQFVPSANSKTKIVRPLWIVGVSPFDSVVTDDQGYVVHLGDPKFTARWTMNDSVISSLTTLDYFDEELGIALYEASAMKNAQESLHEWFLESVCAVAYSKGLLASMEPEILPQNDTY